jgi:crossover junction endodeoxyribonuclease RuvC
VTKTVLGIDVGMMGALAFYDGSELLIHDMPVFDRSKTKRVDCHTLSNIIAMNDCDHAFVEQVNAFGMGVSSAFNFGWSCGVIEAVLSCHKVPFTYITPQKWKKALQVPKDKDASRMRATQLLPEFACNWDLKKHHNRAEAALVALYGWRKLWTRDMQ